MKMYEVFIRVVVSGRFWRKNGSVSDMVCGDTITETDRETHTHFDKTYSTFCAKFMIMNVPLVTKQTPLTKQKVNSSNQS